MTSRELEAIARETVDFYIDLASDIYGRVIRHPRISFELRGKVAGYAYHSKNLLRLNEVLMRENTASFIEDTIPHEVAHLVARAVFPRHKANHGSEWKSVMREFGCSPSRCHSYDTTNSTVRRMPRNYKYKCSCTTHDLTAIRHKRASSGTEYLCRGCKETLTLVA